MAHKPDGVLLSNGPGDPAATGVYAAPQIKKLVVAGNIDRAIKLCDASDYPILQLVKAGLTHANKGPDEIDAALSEKLSELKPAVEKRVGTLWSLANIATLIGLIGTVVGLTRSEAQRRVAEASGGA